MIYKMPAAVSQNDLDQLNTSLLAETTALQIHYNDRIQIKANNTRTTQLDSSSKKRTDAYIKVGTMVIITLACLAVLFAIRSFIPILVMVLFIIIILCVMFYLISPMITDINIRDSVDFDKIVNPPPPSKVDIKTQLAKNGNSGDIFGSFDLGRCMGSQCCGVGSVWDLDSQTCIKKIPNIDASGNIVDPFTGRTSPEAYSKNKDNFYVLRKDV